MDDLINRIPFACKGKTYKDGGLNKSDIQKILKHIGMPYAKGNREQLLATLCQPSEKIQLLLSGKPTPRYICHPKAFVQHIDICWFHASAVSIFLSDDSRTYMWNKVFVFEKNTRKPIGLVPHDYPIHIALVLEMIRRSLELSYDIVFDNLRRFETKSYINKCSKAIFELICYLNEDWCAETDPELRRQTDNGGGYASRLMYDLSQHLPFDMTDDDDEVDIMAYDDNRMRNQK